MSPPNEKQTPTKGKDEKFTQAQVTTPTEPAIERLLGQTEMMELILLNLPMRDLLLCTRVCRTFRDVINGSLKLKRALFLEPAACGPLSYIEWRYDDKEMYPVSMNLGKPLRGENRDQAPNIYPRHWGKTRDDTGDYRIFVNPLLAEKFPVLQENGCYFKGQETDLPASMRHGLASWRKMYFTQPPIEHMILEEDCGPDSAIESDDGEEDDNTTLNATNNPAAAATNPTAPAPAAPFAPGAAGINMENLFYRLVDLGLPTWIEGRDLWEKCRGAEDLEKVVVRGK